MAGHSLSASSPPRHPQKPTDHDVQVWLDALHVLLTDLSNIAEEREAAKAKLHPPALRKRMDAIEKKYATAMAKLYPSDLPRRRAAIEQRYREGMANLQPPDIAQRRDAIEQQHRQDLAAILPPDYNDRVVALEQKKAAALNALEPPDLDARRAALNEQRLKELEELEPEDIEERCAALEQERDEAFEQIMPKDFEEHLAAIDQEFAAREADLKKAAQEKDAQIRAGGRELEHSVRGTHMQMIYQRGQRRCNYDRLEEIAQFDPAVRACIKYGAPIIKVQAVRQEWRERVISDIHRRA